MMLRLIPKVFYEDIEVGLDLFVAGLGFAVLHRDETLVVGRDGVKAYLVEDAKEFAVRDTTQVCVVFRQW